MLINMLNNVTGLWHQDQFSFNLIENLFLNKGSEPTIRFLGIPAKDDKGKISYVYREFSVPRVFQDKPKHMISRITREVNNSIRGQFQLGFSWVTDFKGCFHMFLLALQILTFLPHNQDLPFVTLLQLQWDHYEESLRAPGCHHRIWGPNLASGPGE